MTEDISTTIGAYISMVIGKATGELYNLDVRLSNSYTGVASSEHDQALVAIRKPLRIALDALSSPGWIGELKRLIPTDKGLAVRLMAIKEGCEFE